MKQIVHLTLVIASLLTFSSVFAAPVAPPSTRVSYENYQALIRQKTSQVPELQPLWNWTNSQNVSGVYLGGGILRGLLLWLNQQLATHDFEAVRGMQVPDIRTLLIQKDADLDIFATDALTPRIKGWQPYAAWDVLGETFYRHSVANGGPTFDRIRVSPNQIDDPLNALHDFYEGRLMFRAEGTPFRQNYDTNVLGDNWLNLALRFIRFTHDLRPVIDADPNAITTIRNLAAQHRDWIPVNTATDLNWPTPRTADLTAAFRVRKALNKLYKATTGNDVEFVRTLKNYHLLDMLSHRYYNVASFSLARFPALVTAGRAAGLSLLDLSQFAQMNCHVVTACLDLHRALLRAAHTPEEAILALTPMRRNMSEQYRVALRDLWITSLAEDGPLKRAEFRAESVLRLERDFNWTSFSMALKHVAFNNAHSFEDRLAILQPAFAPASELYSSNLRTLIGRVAPVLAADARSYSQTRQLEDFFGHHLGSPEARSSLGMAWAHALMGAANRNQSNQIIDGFVTSTLSKPVPLREQFLATIRDGLVEKDYSFQFYNTVRRRLGLPMQSRQQAAWPAEQRAAGNNAALTCEAMLR